MVMDTSPTSFSERLSGENPQPRFVPAGPPGGAGLRALYLETGAAQQLQARLTGVVAPPHRGAPALPVDIDRKSTRLNSSHANLSYAVFCLKKKTPIGTS